MATTQQYDQANVTGNQNQHLDGSQVHNRNDYQGDGTGNHLYGTGQNHNGTFNNYNEKPYPSSVSHGTNPGFHRVANPSPLGLLSFALTTLCFGFYNCGVGLPGSDPLDTVGPYHAIFGLAIFYGGAVQAIAGIMEFRAGNTYATTVHLSYGAFWLSFAMFMIPSLGLIAAYDNQRAFTVHLGIYLMAWALLSLIFFVSALRTNIAVLAVYGLFTLSLFFLSIAQFIYTNHHTNAIRINRTGGAFAIICGLAAFYAGAAGLMSPSTTSVRLPLGDFPPPKRTGKSAA